MDIGPHPIDTVEQLQALERNGLPYVAPLPTVRINPWLVLAGLVAPPILIVLALALLLLDQAAFLMVLCTGTTFVVGGILVARWLTSRKKASSELVGRLIVSHSDPSTVTYRWFGPDELFPAAVLGYAHHTLRSLVVSESPEKERRAMGLAALAHQVAASRPSPPAACVEGPGSTDRTVYLHREPKGLRYEATGELGSLIHGPDELQAAAAIRLLALLASRLDLAATEPMWTALLTTADPDQEAFRAAAQRLG